ncbi:MAG: hypothetical protein JJ992_01805, partial [Planctomycetes bacterium]|nr:hypothetical protein [Planctomycetota bacterium]
PQNGTIIEDFVQERGHQEYGVQERGVQARDEQDRLLWLDGSGGTTIDAALTGLPAIGIRRDGTGQPVYRTPEGNRTFANTGVPSILTIAQERGIQQRNPSGQLLYLDANGNPTTAVTLIPSIVANGTGRLVWLDADNHRVFTQTGTPSLLSQPGELPQPIYLVSPSTGNPYKVLDVATQEVQEFAISRTSQGKYRIAWGADPSDEVTLDYNATRDTIATELAKLNNLDADDFDLTEVSRSGSGELSATYRITFQGRYADRDVPQLIVRPELGFEGQVAVATNTPGPRKSFVASPDGSGPLLWIMPDGLKADAPLSQYDA